MKYKIIGDSCCDISKANEVYGKVEIVPLTLSLEGKEYVDDETFNQKEFIDHVAAAKDYARSACSSPQRYMEAYEGDYDCVFVVTLSGNLSGSYNSAMTGMKMYYEENPGDPKKIHVFDSCSASCGEGNIAQKIYELAESNLSFEEIVEKVEAYSLEMKTYFVIETLEPLRKNGRLSNLKAIVASVLNIKPVMSASDEGLIIQLGQARGMERALKKMIDYIVENTKNIEEKVLAISHVNCLERAKWVKDEILKLAKFKDITIADTAGVATLYANDGGIIVAV
ncbi:MAG: DegV family protein [Lachnospiraceae bacterium]|nr:DegV family protein [Lachnospiraceae bacterium]MEE0685742.1 DegV family protein [Lachnospiraceae bacterium]MEE0862425.1 DegV family protein [Lachnospiraceae bacterium]